MTDRADKEVAMEPRDEAKVGALEHAVHNPHDVTTAVLVTVQCRHNQRNVRRWLVVDQQKRPVADILADVVAHLHHCSHRNHECTGDKGIAYFRP